MNINQIYGNRLRVRACGICFREDKILLVEHCGMNESNSFWCSPGGGVEFGETAEECLIREFEEETGLDIAVKKLLFVNEFIKSPLHAVELFFDVEVIGGDLKIGSDPELNIIKNVKWLSLKEISAIPEKQKHDCFNFTTQNNETRFGNAFTTYFSHV
jgi:8-oxo-dGTP diphosphatase